MKQFNPLDPFGAGQRIANALATLFGICFCLYFIGKWLGPWLPVITAVAVLGLIYKWVFRRRG